MLDCSLQVLHTHKPADDDKDPDVIDQNISPPPVPVVTLRPQIHQVSHPQIQNNAAGGLGHRGQKPYDNAPILGAFADQQTKQSHHEHDNPFFEKEPTKELQQLIDRDKYHHNSNRDNFKSNQFQWNSRPADQNMPMFGNDGLDEYLHNHNNLDNSFFPNSAKSPHHKSQHNFHGHSDYPGFEFHKKQKQKQTIKRAKNKRRYKLTQAMRKRPKANLRFFPTRKPQLVRQTQEEVDPFLDLDYIEVNKDLMVPFFIFSVQEMFSGSPSYEYDFPRPGYHAIEETDIQHLERSFF